MANNATVIREATPNNGVKPGTVRKFAENSPAGTIPKSAESYAAGQGGVMANCPMKSAAEVAKMGGAGSYMGHLGHFANDAVLNAGHNTGAHPGFKAVQAKIAAKEGVSKERAGAMLAASTRHASKAAHKANPRLNRVKG